MPALMRKAGGGADQLVRRNHLVLLSDVPSGDVLNAMIDE
jgi:hypothetical protein